ncbi:hypothetical protein HYV86_06420 [Candidatus Woesearchaeota archaeon]|nr:hypothetical protein [Candidatus Woesearchaeota archaeon]
MERMYKIMIFVMMALLVIMTSSLLLLNHQIDSIKHAVGGEESSWEMWVDEKVEEKEKQPTQRAEIIKEKEHTD